MFFTLGVNVFLHLWCLQALHMCTYA